MLEVMQLKEDLEMVLKGLMKNVVKMVRVENHSTSFQIHFHCKTLRFWR